MTFYCSVCKNIYDITDNVENIIDKKSTEDKNMSSKSSYFICTTCGHYEQIVPETLILTKTVSGVNQYIPLNVNPDHKINNCVLLKTRNYICPNEKCETHKHPEIRSACLEHINHKSFITKYICSICKTQWT